MATTRGRGHTNTSPPTVADLHATIRDRVVDLVADKINEKALKHEQVAAKAARKAEVLQRIGSGLGALDVWIRTEPHGRKPRFTRDEIAAAAIAIADSEGFGALSMRRLALELDAGTMTLYHYVRTKDELLALVTDAVMGEVVVPDDVLPVEWRSAITMLATRTRDALRRHPWMLDISDDPRVGPNGVRHFDQTLQAVSGLDLQLRDKADIVTTVDEFVFGYCAHHRHHVAPDDAGGDAEMLDYVAGLVVTGGYPQLAQLADEMGLGNAWALFESHLRDPDRFERNLARVLDGIAASFRLDAC